MCATLERATLTRRAGNGASSAA